MSKNRLKTTPTREFLTFLLKMIALTLFTLLFWVSGNYLGLLMFFTATFEVAIAVCFVYCGFGLAGARLIIPLDSNKKYYDFQEDHLTETIIPDCFFDYS
jgi:hypothetical protein